MSDWWRSAPEILGSDYERVYRLDPEVARREVDSILVMSEIRPGASVLDLCCGVGRHAVEFARRGFDVAGLDISPTFLDVARRKATEAGVRVAWVQGDMREVFFQDRFDLVVNLFGAWGYFATDAENEQVLRNVARALRRGGRFVLDFFNHDWIIRYLPTLRLVGGRRPSLHGTAALRHPHGSPRIASRRHRRERKAA